MSRLNERDIARELAESERFEPPAGLLEKIKAEIPQEVRVGTTVPGTASRSFVPRSRWPIAIAASLLVGVGAGIVGLRTWESRGAEGLKAQAHPAAPQSVAAKMPAPAAPAVPASPPPPPAKADDTLRGAPVARMAEESKAAPAPAAKPEPAERRDLAALGYLSEDKQRVQQPAQPVQVPQSVNAPSAAARAASPPAEQEAEKRAEGAVVGGTAAGAAPAPPAAAAESQAPRQKALMDQNAASPTLQLKKEKDQKTRRASATPFEAAETHQFQDAIAHPVSAFRLDVDTASYAVARRALLEGRLPDPASVRVEEWLNAFEDGDPAPVHGDFAIRAEGSPSPFTHGPEYRLLRFNIKARQGTVLRNAEAQVEFNSVVVARYRLLGAALYEIELRKNAPHWEQLVATLQLHYRMPGNGTTETIHRVGFQDFVPALEQASPALRLTALVAELAEILRDRPWEKQAALAGVARRIQELAPLFPGNPRVAELADLAGRAARLAAAVQPRPEE